MPELPEVETTRRGVEPLVFGRHIQRVIIRERRLRQMIPKGFSRFAHGKMIGGVGRRAKYLLFELDQDRILVHLGMSGSIRVIPRPIDPGPHDHVDWQLDDGSVLRYRDPRRFGLMLPVIGKPDEHPLLAALGPEPFDSVFDGRYLWKCARGRRQAVKAFIMDGKVVTGVGNIYASEALYNCGIHPRRPAGRVSAQRYQQLTDSIRQILGNAIEAGGTTLRDFSKVDGEPGYFEQELQVYDREGLPCKRCGDKIRREVMGQRSTFFCVSCQS